MERSAARSAAWRTRAIRKTACDDFGFRFPGAASFQKTIGHAKALTGSGAADLLRTSIAVLECEITGMKNLAGHLKALLGIGNKGGDRESFERLFSRFRAVLDSNNRSLEIITEMGDVLGGDYLFDVQYVKGAYAALSASLNESLLTFDELTQNRYPRLHDVVSKIDERIRRGIDAAVPASRELVVFYEDITPDLAEAVGGKNANLVELRNALKLNVPEAFAVTTHAFDSFMRHNRIFEKITETGGGAPLSSSCREELYELVLHGEIPPDLGRALERAVRKLGTRCGKDCSISVRSSAGEEDGEFSFAGQFETVLNVPLEPEALEKAYKKVIASLFSPKASAYGERLGYDVRNIRMAVGCVEMVDAAVSGVLYSSDPGGDPNSLIINAAWGLGPSVVEGGTDVDHYAVTKDGAAEILEERTGKKDTMVVRAEGGGVSTVETPAERKGKPCLASGQLAEIARLGREIEKHFRRPQDVEWAIDGKGTAFILQARPLRMPETVGPGAVPPAPDAQIIFKNRGLVVQKGVGAGKVWIIRHNDDLVGFPNGAVLVARHDSSLFVRVMPFVSAIITEVGTQTSHMAALCRELKIPTIVNAAGAMKILQQGQEVTVVADDTGGVVYQGRVRALLEHAAVESMRLDELYEFRKKRYLLRFLAPLNLVDPLRDDFTPEACRTAHDVLRFIHEKSVAELIEAAGYGLKSGRTVKLDLPIPAGIMLIDIGGGLANQDGQDHAGPEQVTSIPFKSLIAGMAHPGVWRSDAVPLTAHDFMTSMLRIPDITTDSASHVGSNIAVISREYMNLSLKFGYHFTVVDCYCSPRARNNHVYFRFAGGATDITKRSRRLQVIERILGQFGFNLKTRGDLIIARLANIRQEELVNILDQVGRLIAYTRQLDAVLHDERSVELYAGNFMQGDYEFKGNKTVPEHPKDRR